MDRINTKNAEARARDFSMSMPKNQVGRTLLIEQIARAIQEEHGSFIFDQIYDILELVYKEDFKKNADIVLMELENWVEQNEHVELLDSETGFYIYRLND